MIRVEKQNFALDTKNTSYRIHVTSGGHLLHMYYGKAIDEVDVSYSYAELRRPWCIHDYEDDSFSRDAMPYEYATFGMGDYRISAIDVEHQGNITTDLRCVDYKIHTDKPQLEGLPSSYIEAEDTAQTLEIILKDALTSVKVQLYYTVFEGYDVITRHCVVTNEGEEVVNLDKVMSLCMEFSNQDYDFVHLEGRWASERNVVRQRLQAGIQSIGSKRGASSHQHNPFFALCKPMATEEMGEVYGFNFIYSGSFEVAVECDHYDTTRVVMGINPYNFKWELKPGARFTAPEAFMTHTQEGMGELSRKMHRFVGERICRGYWRDKKRPLLINNWEGTYFDFTEEKLLNIARQASELGIEMLVMDDGWFGERNDDTKGLGDWFVNEKKLKGGLKVLVDEVNKLGMKFGIWFEPEMVNEKSALYQQFPEWCLQIQGRKNSQSRKQFVLDLSRPEVVNYLYDCIRAILNSANIEYVKWDMNRHMTQVGSLLLPPHRQQETTHRYMLGVYDLMERLYQAFPKILFEGCSGGGGRFDCGMLSYGPQIWASDNTDPIERLKIQYGTSLAYPVMSMGSHVAASPNHQTGRKTSMDLRSAVALAGSFGYELDPERLTDEEKEAIKKQVADYHKYYDLIHFGDYHRLVNPEENTGAVCWQFVDKAKQEVLITYVQVSCEPIKNLKRIYPRGLDMTATYEDTRTGKCYKGDTLMNVGMLIPHLYGDGVSYMIHLKVINS